MIELRKLPEKTDNSDKDQLSSDKDQLSSYKDQLSSYKS